MENRMKALYNQVIFERRILFGCTALVGLSVCIWSVAIGTDHWFMLKSPNNQGLPLGGSNEVGRRLIYKHVGLWRSCTDGLEPQPENSTNLVHYIPIGHSSVRTQSLSDTHSCIRTQFRSNIVPDINFQSSTQREVHPTLRGAYSETRGLSLYGYIWVFNFRSKIHPPLLRAYSAK